MGPTKELIDAIYRERVLHARQQPGVEKLLDGPRLFEFVCRVMRDGIRGQFPEADERRVEQILAERIALLRRLDGEQ